MRSRSCTMGGPEGGRIQTTRGLIQQEENQPDRSKRRPRVQRDQKEGRTSGSTRRTQNPPDRRRSGLPDLSRTDLLHLLGVMEGELQAREDIISLLRADRTGPEVLEAHYGSSAPLRPLQALQRDGQVSLCRGADDVYEKPMAELERLEDQQRDTYRRMLEQLLLAEKLHRRTVVQLDQEKNNHQDFISKSDDFTNLLEQDRERLKRLLEQEKAYRARQDQDHSRRLEKVRAELLKLKSFALLLVDERQLHLQQIHQQGQKLQDCNQKLQETEQRLAEVAAGAEEDRQKVLKLEAELEHRGAKFTQEHEEVMAKLTNEEAQSRTLRGKLVALARKVEELEESKKVLQRSEEDLRELREKISRGDSSQVAELENLKKKVLEMEGKDEEITKTESQCREMKKKFQDEENHGTELRLEVDQLQKRMVELEKLEGAFSRSKAECSQLHTSLEKEKRVVKDLTGELETLKTGLRDLESSEAKLEEKEMVLKDDLVRMKSFMVMLVDQRKNTEERLKQEEQKSEDLSEMLKSEQSKVTDVTEKLIEESKKLLRFKAETESSVTALVQEKDQVQTRLASEEEKTRELKTKMSEMKMRMDRLEETEKGLQKKLDQKRTSEDNRTRELSVEIERLRSRLEHLEVVEGDLMKTEDQYDLLEKKFLTEQDKANALSKTLEEMKGQIARSKALEKGELTAPEAQLRIRCKVEEAKSRELQLDITALKEKIHELMNKEDQLAQLQADYAVLQRRFLEEEERRRTMSFEVAHLVEELEATRRYSRSWRPGGSRMENVPVASTAVQTDATDERNPEDQTAAGFIRKSVLEENHFMRNLRQQGPRRPPVLERYPPAAAELGTAKSWIPWMKKKEAIAVSQANERLRPPEMTTPPKPGQPLRIRVTPDLGGSSATLEISSPPVEDFFSSTTIIPTLGPQRPRITIVPKTNNTPDTTGGLHRARSPVTITTVSRATSSDATVCTSPVSIITVSSTPVSEACAAPEPHGVTMGCTVVKVTPEPPPGPLPHRKYNGKSSIVTTDDNKIHIHLGPQGPRPTPTGTVLRSPRQPSMGKTTPSKMTSSITIMPVGSAPCRPSQPALTLGW
ncbi:filamin-A-interacting protein 1-like isoform X2 [Antennarius striatus]|uniref:filamin-A-interacting protein 1-like isoform X2 n=1 Tax=Antennarius striatus TaxID=241820 RepID=UPI0035B043B9